MPAVLKILFSNKLCISILISFEFRSFSFVYIAKIVSLQKIKFKQINKTQNEIEQQKAKMPIGPKSQFNFCKLWGQGMKPVQPMQFAALAKHCHYKFETILMAPRLL